MKALTAASLTLALACVTGCGSSWLDTQEQQADTFQPEDFVSERVAADPTDPQAQGPVADGTDATDNQSQGYTTDPDNAQDGTGESGGTALSVNAMIGQVNGEAIYADQIFEVNIIAQLESFGRRYDNEQFRAQSTPVIEERLMAVVMDHLILGEAELSLDDRNRQIVDLTVQREREEKIRFYGQGSIARAEAEFFDDQGITLDQHLTNMREQLTIGIYLRGEILPRISVNQAQVERYYENNIDQFQQIDRRVLRFIRIDAENNPGAVSAVQTRLSRGESFESVASDAEVNANNPANAGVYNGGVPYPGELGIEPLNEAMLPLQTGEHAGPVTVGESVFFIQVAEFLPGASISLADAQVDIEQILFNQQRTQLLNRFRMEQLRSGNYTDLTQMSLTLIEIASTRYDR